MFTDKVITDAARNGFRTVVVDGISAVDDTVDALAERFELLQ
jgi:hypothetical protein